MSNNKPIQFKLFCEILTKIDFFWKFFCEIFLEYFLAIYLLTANIFGSDLMALSEIAHALQTSLLFGPSDVGLYRQKGREI
jgi:hypothetical protein